MLEAHLELHSNIASTAGVHTWCSVYFVQRRSDREKGIDHYWNLCAGESLDFLLSHCHYNRFSDGWSRLAGISNRCTTNSHWSHYLRLRKWYVSRYTLPPHLTHALSLRREYRHHFGLQY